MHFIDEATIQAIGGIGGNGCMSFRREKYEAMGGPNGGNGGNGGDVYLIAKKNMQTLSNLRGKYRYKAKKGAHGSSNNKTGFCGENYEIEVPIGTLVYDIDSEQLLGDLISENQKLIIARGGKGGRGNASYQTSVNQAPRRFEEGKEGQIKNIRLELKVLADVGLVGFPNAGKSTLISHLSNAKPEIASYPFSTLTPQLGVVHIKKWESFIMADIPGIISGAHEGKGLGLRFLKHIERTKVLVFLIDVFDENINKTFNVLRSELSSFNKKLLAKPFVVVLNKIDSLLEEDIPDIKQDFLSSSQLAEENLFFISALKKIGLDELKTKVFELIKSLT